VTGSEQQPLAPAGPADAGELEPGFAVGEYRIEGPLGKGGMGTVYAARQPEIGARVAIKVLAADRSRDPRLVRRFVDEARAVNQIRHPNIIDIFAFGRLADGRHYFVMEHLDGETLAARLARGPLPVSDARRLLAQICEALAAAHAEKIVHRDLKPENIWIAAPRRGQPYAKILDFGIAKLLDSRDAPGTTEAGVAMGTPYFMSPEQCRGEAVDHRTDIYAMGVLLYLMWSGRLPFEGTSFVAVASQQITATPAPPSAHRAVPARLEQVILRCLEKDPARRPPNAEALREDLDEALAEAMPGETLPPAAERIDRRPELTRETGPSLSMSASTVRSRPKRIAIAAAAVAMVVVVVVAAVSIGAAVRSSGREDHRAATPAAVAPPGTAPAAIARQPGSAPAAMPALPAASVASRTPTPTPTPTPTAKTTAETTAKTTARRKRTLAPADEDRPVPSTAEQRGFLRENPFR
jgi:serine/threonine-protein kinase